MVFFFFYHTANCKLAFKGICQGTNERTKTVPLATVVVSFMDLFYFRYVAQYSLRHLLQLVSAGITGV